MSEQPCSAPDALSVHSESLELLATSLNRSLLAFGNLESFL